MKTKEILIAALVVLFLGFLLTGCTTESKAVKYMNSHAFDAARYCATAFPVKDSIIYKPGQTIIRSDTTVLPGDSIPCPDQEPGQPPAVVHCPPSRIIHDSIFVHDTTTIIRENTAKTADLTGQLAIATSQYAKARKWKPRTLWTWGILAVLIGGGVILKVKSII